jgi:hypothetical protein
MFAATPWPYAIESSLVDLLKSTNAAVTVEILHLFGVSALRETPHIIQLTGLQIQSDAGVVATPGAPTSTHNTLHFRVQDGGTISDLSWQLTADQLSAGELFVGWVVDLGNDEIRLIMDGLDLANNQKVVASAPFTGSDWSGLGVAGFGNGTSTVGGYSGFSSFVADPLTSVTINTTEGLDFFQDQAFLPSPVPEPMGVLAGFAAIGFTFFRHRRALQ